MDSTDRGILGILDRDAEASAASIAEKLGISRQLVNLRIHRLERDGVISGHLTIIDTGTFGYAWYRLLIRLFATTQQTRAELISFLSTHPNTVWIGEVGGRWDVAANFACKSHVEFNQIFEDIAERFGKSIRDSRTLVYANVTDYSRKYLDPENPTRAQFVHRMDPNPKATPDPLDLRILSAVSQNARATMSSLERELRISPATIQSRLKRMERNGVVLGTRTFVNLERIGYQSHIVLLRINALDRERETELYLYFAATPSITFVVKHLDSWRIGLEVETRDEREFQQVLLGIRSQFSDLIDDFDAFPLLRDHVINYLPKAVSTRA